MSYTLGEAARATGRNKSTILRAIKAGVLSATRDPADGGWQIEPAELHRVYPAIVGATQDATPNATTRNGDATSDVMAELRARLADKDAVIDDLRRRLDAEAEERRRLTAILADQRAKPEPVAEPPTPARRQWWRWRRA